jgi:Pyruvate/2-oxoacid:ferredoxin oxidoreductase delta subunit
MRPILNDRKCPSQGQICKAITACPEGSIRYADDEELPLEGRIVFDYEKCHECGIYITECYGSAI